MPRSKGGATTRRRHKRLLKKTEGYFGTRRKLITTAKDALNKALKYGYVGRKLKKRDNRALWQVRIGAAAKELGTSYSKLMGTLKKKNIRINRKMLSELAKDHPDNFKDFIKKIM